LLAYVVWYLPGYARHYSLGEMIAPLTDTPRSVPIACFPRVWDSVPFYLNRSDIAVYSKEQRDQLFSDLLTRSRTLLFAKQPMLEPLRHELRARLEYMPCGQEGTVTVGWVRIRNR